MIKNLINLQDALIEIKNLIEKAIKKTGTEGKNNLIRSQKPIKLLHDVVKSELIRNRIDSDLIKPALGERVLTRYYFEVDKNVISSD